MTGHRLKIDQKDVKYTKTFWPENVLGLPLFLKRLYLETKGARYILCFFVIIQH